MRKILVVEDEDSIREVIALNLRMAGYEVAKAGSAEQALALLGAQAHFAAAILDLMLPGMSGFSLCETIRRDNNALGIIMPVSYTHLERRKRRRRNRDRMRVGPHRARFQEHRLHRIVGRLVLQDAPGGV